MTVKSTKVTGPGLKADARYGSLLISKFINCLMWDGKKTVAEKIFYGAMDLIAKKVQETPANEVFETAVNNVKPLVEVKSRRVGGATYQVPVDVSKKRQMSLAFRWIIHASRAKKGKPMAERLSGELLDAFNKQGAAMSVRENTHRMAEANKAFAHFAW